jgi:hypothetical protein
MEAITIEEALVLLQFFNIYMLQNVARALSILVIAVQLGHSGSNDTQISH